MSGIRIAMGGTALLALLLPQLGQAIIIRHDVPEAAHQALARELPQPVVLLAGPRGAADGQGVLIAPRWVLTAAHVARRLRPGIVVHHAGGESEVLAVFAHPDYRRGTPTDIALVQLRDPLPGATVSLASGAPQSGEEITIIGRGDIGDGLSGPSGPGREVLAGTNLITEVSERYFNFSFESPEDGALPLEAVNGGGDSGNATFAYRDGELRLLGISSGQDGMGFGPGRYGVVEYIMSVPYYLPWIREVMGASEDP